MLDIKKSRGFHKIPASKVQRESATVTATADNNQQQQQQQQHKVDFSFTFCLWRFSLTELLTIWLTEAEIEENGG